MKLHILILISCLSSAASAARLQGSSKAPTLSYDLGFGNGSMNKTVYTELDGGLSWTATEHLLWRNAIFTRFGSKLDTVTGLDTSARLFHSTPYDGNGFGVGFFIGPGYRFADKNNSGVFGETGMTLRMAGFSSGVGIKNISYNDPGIDKDGMARSRNETVIFAILSAYGAL